MALLQHADYLATHLESVPALDGVPVLVDRDLDIVNAINQHIEQGQGRLILITWLGWPDPGDSDGPLLTLRHRIALLTVPTLLEQASLDTFDQLFGALVDAVNHYSPDTTGDPFCARHWTIGAGRLLSVPNFLAWSFDASIDDDIAAPIA